MIDRGEGLIYCDVLDVTFLDHPASSVWQDPGQPGVTLALIYAENLEYHDPVRDVIWDD